MLRRKPTAITIAPEDLNAFEEARAKENIAKYGHNPEADRAPNQSAGGIDPNDELKPLPGDKARIIRSREERIGIGGGR
ncbi:MAG: hypothetical protein Q9160_002500 [Pyrenula sp. 1 TL-2023]